MSVLCFEDWYDKSGHTIEEEIEDWLNSCPSTFIELDYFDIQDIIESEYEAYIGEYEDRCYDEWKDSQL